MDVENPQHAVTVVTLSQHESFQLEDLCDPRMLTALICHDQLAR